MLLKPGFIRVGEYLHRYIRISKLIIYVVRCMCFTIVLFIYNSHIVSNYLARHKHYRHQQEYQQP